MSTNQANRRASSRLRTNSIRPSRDGDQFHYLWAARRCLRLLLHQTLPEDNLIKISIEGVSPDEWAGESFTSVGEEVIDVAEYFGDEKKLERIRYIQLKHSTRQKHAFWTASGLEKTITAFAERYKDLCSSSSNQAPENIEFCFITNKRISPRLITAVKDAVAGTKQRYLSELKKLERFTGLKSDSLISFLKLLRFEDCQEDYWEQRNILCQETGNYLPGVDSNATTQLRYLVNHKALSEGEKNPDITKIDVLRVLNVNEDDLFPAPCMIEDPGKNTISFPQEQEFIRTIIEASSPVVIHADGGVGKTVFATRIQANLPNGSECILYDCFGNGSYRNPRKYRHRHQDALVQIANELATRGFCHPLIPSPHADTSLYMKAFFHRIGQASELARLNNSDALICIVVDAADNAQMASEEIDEKHSFVQHLVKEKEMPDNVRLVFLCRTHRQSYLGDPLPSGIISLELSPFDTRETKLHLRQKFANATDYDVEEFHYLSSGNPRVQALALSRSDTLTGVLSSLGQKPTTIASMVKGLLDKVIEEMKNQISKIEQTQIDKICRGLALLRPQIPISILSKISGVDEGAIRSFVTDFGRSLLYTDGVIQFLDEPTETWFRERYLITTDEMNEFIASLEPLAVSDIYVASILPQLMLKVGKFPDLIELALTSKGLPKNHALEKHNVEIQRLQFALKAALRSNNYLASAKLALKAGREAAGKNRWDRVLQENTDLVAKFSKTEYIRDVISQRTLKSSWFGSRYVYEAALLSNHQRLIRGARNRLRTAHEYLENWSKLPKKEREKISDQDIVALTIAHINVHGPEDGACQLGRWQPSNVSLRAGSIVTRRLIEHDRIRDVEAFARAAKVGNNLHLILAIISELQEVQLLPPEDVTRHAFRLIKESLTKSKDSQEFNLADIIPLVKTSLKYGVCAHDEAVNVISYYLPSNFPRNISVHFPKEWVLILKSYCLCAALQRRELKLRELVVSELQQEIDKDERYSESSELRKFRENVGVLLPWCQLWASVFLGHVTKETLRNEIQRTREAADSMAASYHRSDSHIADEVAFLWFDVLYRLGATDTDTLSVFSDWKDKLPRPLFTPTLISITRLCSKSEATKNLALQYSQEVFDLIKDENIDAGNKSECFIDLARAIMPVRTSKAKWYFRKAVDVAGKVGDENIPRWEAVLSLAERASSIKRPLPDVAYHFASCAELTYDYVAREKYFYWEGTVEALCGLCPSSSLAIMSRWRDRGFGNSEKILPIAINRLIKDGKLNAHDALPLVGFRAQWAYDQLLEAVLPILKTRKEKNATVEYLYRYMQFEGSGFVKFKEVASRHGIKIEGIDERIRFDEIKKSNDNEHINKQSGELVESAPDWGNVFSGHDLTTRNGVHQAYLTFEKTRSLRHHDKFFKEAIERVQTGHEVAFIKAVSNIPEFSRLVLNDFLKQAFEIWKEDPDIKEELQELFKNSFRRFCMDIAKNYYYEDMLNLPLKNACSLAGVSEDEIIDIILNAIGERSDFLDSDRLFSLIELLVGKLSEDEALDALKCGLDFFDDVLVDKYGDGEWSDDLNPPVDIKESLAGYIWASMAAPDSILRWEGAHVTLGLVVLERKEVLGHVFEFADERTGGPFVDAGLPFYDLHALQWFLVGLARAAIESPKALAPFADQIIEWALNGGPHVLIRKFAARTLLTLMSKGVIADKCKSALEEINVSQFPYVKSKKYEQIDEKESIKSSEDNSLYFGFDIGPYWYEPLGRVFGLSQRKIEVEASKIIKREFSSQYGRKRNEDERHKRNIYKEKHTWHSHGSYPRADDLDFYYSYHAMMILAGNLLASTPVHLDEYDGGNKFTNWLSRHDILRTDERWLWDRRDPSPLERPAWQDQKKENGTPFVITKDDFDEALCDASKLNIWGTWTVTDFNYDQIIKIYSALVSPDKSSALLRSLSALEQHFYAIPSVGMEHEIDDFGFRLKGWIVEENSRQRLDHLDRWAGGIEFPPPRPARYIVEEMELETDSDCRFWKDQKKSTVMRSQMSGYFDEKERGGIHSSEQCVRLQANIDFLESMLKQFNYDLIIDVEIEFRRTYQSWSMKYEEEKLPRKNQLYLLKADGKLYTL